MRKIFKKIHLWLSIPFGIIITIVCVTGAILVFEKEILELCYPSHYFVKEVKGEPQSPAALIASARQQLPDSIQINGIRVTADPGRTYQLVLPWRKAAVFIDPYTGEITGMDDGQGFFTQMMRLHRWLLTEFKRDGSFSWGKSLVGWSTLILVIITISGIVIWFPLNRKGLKHRLKIKTKSGWRRFFYDLHISGGFYATLLLLVLSLTGLTWSFNWYRDAFYAVFGVSNTPTQVQASAPAAQKESSQEKVYTERKGEGRGNREGNTETKSSGMGGNNSSESSETSARGGRQQRTADYTQWAEVLATLQEKYDDYNSITIQNGSATVSTAKYGNTRATDRYSFDPATGKITETKLYKDLPDSAKIRGWIYSVHVGTWGGITTKILSCLVSLLGGVFAITGYYFWIRKKVKRAKKHK